jgi:hypothetical protein
MKSSEELAQMQFDAAVDRWQYLKDTIKQFVQEERELRQALFGGMFPAPREGTNKIQFPDGRVAQATYSLNRTFKVKNPFEVLPKPIADMVIRTKTEYELDLKQYRLLDPASKKKVDEQLVVKPALPTLEVLPPVVGDE